MISARIIAVFPSTTNSAAANMHSKFALRRKYVEKTMLPKIQSMGLNAEIFKAVIDGDFSFDGKKVFYANLNLIAESGNVGCFLSHIMLWRLCVERGLTLLVMEDDASLPVEHESTVLGALKEFDSRPDEGDILYLQGQVPYMEIGLHDYAPHTLVTLGDSLYRVSATSDMSGTAAYAIRPIAAQRLFNRVLKTPMCPVDGFIHHTFNAGEIGVVVPKDFKRVFMLNEHYAEWNHVHRPEPPNV